MSLLDRVLSRISRRTESPETASTKSVPDAQPKPTTQQAADPTADGPSAAAGWRSAPTMASAARTAISQTDASAFQRSLGTNRLTTGIDTALGSPNTVLSELKPLKPDVARHIMLEADGGSTVPIAPLGPAAIRWRRTDSMPAPPSERQSAATGVDRSMVAPPNTPASQPSPAAAASATGLNMLRESQSPGTVAAIEPSAPSYAQEYTQEKGQGDSDVEAVSLDRSVEPPPVAVSPPLPESSTPGTTALPQTRQLSSPASAPRIDRTIDAGPLTGGLESVDGRAVDSDASDVVDSGTDEESGPGEVGRRHSGFGEAVQAEQPSSPHVPPNDRSPLTPTPAVPASIRRIDRRRDDEQRSVDRRDDGQRSNEVSPDQDLVDTSPFFDAGSDAGITPGNFAGGPAPVPSRPGQSMPTPQPVTGLSDSGLGFSPGQVGGVTVSRQADADREQTDVVEPSREAIGAEDLDRRETDATEPNRQAANPARAEDDEIDRFASMTGPPTAAAPPMGSTQIGRNPIGFPVRSMEPSPSRALTATAGPETAATRSESAGGPAFVDRAVPEDEGSDTINGLGVPQSSDRFDRQRSEPGHGAEVPSVETRSERASPLANILGTPTVNRQRASSPVESEMASTPTAAWPADLSTQVHRSPDESGGQSTDAAEAAPEDVKENAAKTERSAERRMRHRLLVERERKGWGWS